MMEDTPPPPPVESEPPLAPQEPAAVQESLEAAPAEESAPSMAAQQVLGGSDPVSNFVRNSPFLCFSLVIHLLVLLLLAFMTGQQTIQRQKPVALRLEELPQEEVEVLPLQKEINLTHQGGTVGIPGMSGGGSEGFEGAKGAGPVVNVPTISILGMETAAGAGSGGQFEGHGSGDFALAGGGGKGAGGAVDQFAIITLNCMSQGKTLVVLLIDRSASILYGDLPTVIKRMDHYFEEINLNLPTRIEEVGRWVVVSYGEGPKVECEPTYNLEYLKNALRGVQSDRSGKENVGRAVEYALDNFATKEQYKYVLIAAMTDEAGDDIDNPVYLERVIGRLKVARARFYVFGYESSFCTRSKLVTIPVSQLKGKDLAEYQAWADASKRKMEELTITAWAHGGPECPEPELWWVENWQAWQNWGGSFNNIPSGFGMYGLNRIALSSGGIYFLLKPESNYDEEKLYATYKPDICAIAAYKKRNQESPLRSELLAIWRELGFFQLGGDLREAKEIEGVLKKSLDGRNYCMARIQRLGALLNSPQTAKSPNAGRWLAHGDVTLAELHRYRFMLGQYNEVLRREWQKQGQKVPEGKRYLIGKGKAPDDFVGGELAKPEYDAALQYIQLATERHKGTPWELMGKRLAEGVYPWKCSLADVPPPPKPSTTPPAPPAPNIGL